MTATRVDFLVEAVALARPGENTLRVTINGHTLGTYTRDHEGRELLGRDLAREVDDRMAGPA